MADAISELLKKKKHTHTPCAPPLHSEHAALQSDCGTATHM